MASVCFFTHISNSDFVALFISAPSPFSTISDLWGLRFDILSYSNSVLTIMSNSILIVVPSSIFTSFWLDGEGGAWPGQVGFPPPSLGDRSGRGRGCDSGRGLYLARPGVVVVREGSLLLLPLLTGV